MHARLTPAFVSSSTAAGLRGLWPVVALLMAFALSGCATDSPAADEAACGDGRIDEGEVCDDGNARGGDGCSETCRPERGYTCAGEPSVCTRGNASTCGDGVVTAGEGCDDGNTDPGDGCSAMCAVEPGFRCGGQPSVCIPDDEPGPTEPVCGDGIRQAPETCDDGNTEAGDGCSATCAVEPGWICSGAPSVCEPTSTPTSCGNGTIDEGEACDDGNTTGGDGCSSACQIDAGWRCEGEPSVCFRPCAESSECAELRTGCRNAVCDVDTGQCRQLLVPEGTSCPATASCADGGTCRSGECVPNPPDCSRFDGPCTAGRCTDDGCVQETVVDGTVCGRDEACGADRCDAGECVWAPADDCTACASGGYCVGGRCGGVDPTLREDFTDATIPPIFQMGGNLPWNRDTGTAFRGGASARSGAINHNQSSTMRLNVTLEEAGEVRFHYRTSSEGCCDRLGFFIDGNRRLHTGGAVGWTAAAYVLTAGSHVLEWQYTKDGSVVTGDDAVWVDAIEVTGLARTCAGDCGTALYDGTSCVTCEPRPDGTTCPASEDNPCVVGACEDGSCEDLFVAAGTVCPLGLDNPCLVGRCDEGSCVAEPVPAGTACPLSGSNPCVVGVCDAGACIEDPVAEGTPCGAANECNSPVCSAGVCTDVLAPPCTSCGDGGVCGGGVCGGVTQAAWDFSGPTLPPTFTLGGNQPWFIDTSSFHEGPSSARAGAITHNQSSTMRTTVTVRSPGEVRFHYRVSSEACCDRLRFLINGTERFSTGTVDWTSARYDLPVGTHTLEWRYTKDVSINGGLDTAWVDSIVVTGLAPPCSGTCGTGVFDGESCVTCTSVANGTSCSSPEDPCQVGICDNGSCAFTAAADGTVCGPVDECGGQRCEAGACVPYVEPPCTTCGEGGESRCAAGRCGGVATSFETSFAGGAFPAEFAFAGNQPWRMDTTRVRTGTHAARSGAIADNQTSTMRLPVTLRTAGVVTFDAFVSAESCCDRLRLFVNGTQRAEVSDGANWQSRSVELPAGSHTLEWRFVKDGSVSSGADAAWVDNIRVTGLAEACDDRCAEAVSDGTTCFVCDFRDEGLDCSDPADPCRVASCSSGECLAANAPDCTACAGPSGPTVCAAGVCGGVEPWFPAGPVGSIEASGFRTGGARPWVLQPGAGPGAIDAVTSGAITHNQESWIEITWDIATPGEVRFLWDVSSERNYDFGEVYIDGVRVGFASGTASWTEQRFPLAPGTRTVRWRYVKDGSTNTGQDRFRIAGVRLELPTLCSIEGCEVGVYNGGDCSFCPPVDPLCVD